MMRATVIAILVFFAGFSACHGQLRDSSRNGIMLGILQNPGGNPNVMISYERLISSHISIVVAGGLMPKKSGIIFPKWLTYHLAIDVRYYVNRKSKLPMSGFFVGPFAAYQESYVWYPETGKKAYRFYKPSLGISFGYQQLFWKQLRLTAGLKVGRHGKETNEYWDSENHLVYRNIWPAWWIWYPSISIGYSF
jgi:hypothetical protein